MKIIHCGLHSQRTLLKIYQYKYTKQDNVKYKKKIWLFTSKKKLMYLAQATSILTQHRETYNNMN